MTRIAVIGGGKIGEALIVGLRKSGRATKDLVVAEHFEARAKELSATYGIRVTHVADAVEGADVIVVAVKPDDVDSVLNAIGEVELDGERDQMLISLVAGVPTSRFELKLPAGFPVVRAMPNMPAQVGMGMSAIAPGRYAREKHLELVNEVLGAVGRVTTISEKQIDAATAVSGSGPAYFFLVVEAMVDAAVGLGLSHATATELVVQTMVGSATMLAEGEGTPAKLRAEVTSPAGTTAAALRELERHGVRSAFIEAMHAAKARSVQLGSDTES